MKVHVHVYVDARTKRNAMVVPKQQSTLETWGISDEVHERCYFDMEAHLHYVRQRLLYFGLCSITSVRSFTIKWMRLTLNDNNLYNKYCITFYLLALLS